MWPFYPPTLGLMISFARHRGGRGGQGIMTRPGQAVLEAEGVEQDTELQL